MAKWSEFLLSAALLTSGVATAQMPYFRISKGNEVGFLFGTIHTNRPEAFQFVPGMLDSLQSCPTVAVEIDLGSVNLAEVADKVMMRGDTVLSALIGTADRLLIQHVFTDSLGLPPQMVERIQPLYLSGLIAQAPASSSQQQMPLDMWLSHSDQLGDSARVVGLETLAFQLELFHRVPYATQAAELCRSLRQSLSGSDPVNDMLALYTAGDLNALYDNIEQEMPSADFEQIFIVERNKSMTEALIAQLKKNRVFAAVGAAHLPRETGMLALLKQAGYTVEEIGALDKPED